MKSNHGFTLIELLLVIGIAVIIFVFSVPYSLNFYRAQLVEDARSNIISALQRAKHNAVLQKNDSNFGVHLETGGYTLFQGDNYGDNPSQDETYSVIDSIIFSGLTDVYFNKLTGLPNDTGTTTITYDNVVREFYLNEFGTVSKVE